MHVWRNVLPPITGPSSDIPRPFFDSSTQLILLLFSFLQLFLCCLSFHHLIGPLADFFKIVGFRFARFRW
jgi:hypothetical protein